MDYRPILLIHEESYGEITDIRSTVDFDQGNRSTKLRREQC